MKKIPKLSLIMLLTCFLIVCFSSSAFADQEGYSGRKVSEEVKNGKSTTITESTSEIIIAKENHLTVDGTSYEVKLVENAEGKPQFVLTDGNQETTLDKLDVKNKDGSVIASASANNITYDEKAGGYVIKLGDVLDEEGFEKLEFSFTDAQGVIYSGNLPISDIKTTTTSTNYSMPKTLFGIAIKTASDIFTINGTELMRTVNYILNSVLVPFGDGVLAFVSRSVGSILSIRNIVFGKVERVSINYWDKITDTSSVRYKMSGVIKYWYNVFYKVAIIAYLIILVVVGILVMLDSTAEKKAKYKDLMVSWVVGAAILTLFPYVMKYVVDLNNAFVHLFEVSYYGENAEEKQVDTLLRLDAFTVNTSFGTDRFASYVLGTDVVQMTGNSVRIDMSKSNDIMMQVRILGSKTQQVFLVAIYLIMLGETIALLIMYYKRAFMLAFLITIFPLVAMTYVIDKVGDKRAQSFGIWFKEYIVNVIVQIFHVAVYILVVESSVRSYFTTNGRNWLFVILSVLFLFQGEKIFRNIFGIKSSANTIGDLATSGLAAYGAVKSLGKLTGKNGKDNASEEDKSDSVGIAARNASRADAKTAGTPQDTKSDGSGADENNTSERGGAGVYEGKDPPGVDTRAFDGEEAFDKTVKGAMGRRLTRGLASRAVRYSGGVIGATMGATREMAKGDTGNGILGNALVGAGAGRELGQWAATPLTAGVNKVEQHVQGRNMAKKIENGEMDKELGIVDPALTALPADVNPGEVIGTNGETMQEIYRKALAEAARTSATAGRAAAEIKFLEYLDKHTKKK